MDFESLVEWAAAEALRSTYRQRIEGFRLPSGIWAYEVRPLPGRVKRHILERRARVVPPEPRSDTGRRARTQADFDRIMRDLPKCAQTSHLFESKTAIPSYPLAARFVTFLRWNGHPRARFYPCELSAPAIGRHYHVTTSGRR